MSDASQDQGPWYSGITRYQWLVLLIASLGWVFDIFEGQIFVASMNDAMPALVPPGTEAGTIEFYKKVTLGCFLIGGAIGGVFFGILSDRIGRCKTMIYTILMYSAFTCVSSLSQTWWHMAVFRFLVAMGVGGEWAVASAMVAEVFPKRARAKSLGIFHASSVLGTYLAVAAGWFIPVIGWRWGFALGALPAFLTIWIRMSLKEPDDWERARSDARTDLSKKLGGFSELFRSPHLRNTIVGIGLGTVGLTTFWGAHVFGKDLMKRDAARELVAAESVAASDSSREAILASHQTELKRWEMLGMFLVTTGGGLGLLSFGPLCERIGRRGAFLFFHVGAVIAAVGTFQFASGTTLLMVVLPVFGYLTLGMHAGYAIYFPELFPTRLRGSGAGLCFNLARLLVFPLLVLIGWMQRESEEGGLGLSPENAATYLSALFLVGAALLIWAPETRDQELPE